MSLADYTSLKTAVGDWLHRTDLGAPIVDFIAMFEADFNRDERLRNMDTVTTIAATAGYLQHPTDWLEWQNIAMVYGANTFQLKPASQEQSIVHTFSETSGIPRYWQVTGDKTYLSPTPTATATFTFPTTYYGKLPSLSVSNTTNWLLTAYPTVYLYGALLQASGYIGEDARIPLWKSAYDEAIDAISVASARSQYGTQVIQMRPESFK